MRTLRREAPGGEERPAAREPEPYGLGINSDHVDFVQFVNGVLEEVRADGRWTKSYNTWLADSLGKAPTPPKPVYGRTP